MQENKNTQLQTTATASDCSSLTAKNEGLQKIRRHPKAYIGEVSEKSYNNCVFIIVDNSIREYALGYGRNIDVTLNAEGSCTVRDEGRGIPVEMYPGENLPAIEVFLSQFSLKRTDASGFVYRNRCGVNCVNALSEWMEVITIRDGQRYRLRFKRGEFFEHLKNLGPSEETGTTVTFYPDNSIFKEPEGYTYSFRWDLIAEHLNELAYLYPGVRISLRDEESGRCEEFSYEDGIAGYVRKQTIGEKLVTPNVMDFCMTKKIGHDDATDKDMNVEVRIAMIYTKTYTPESILTYSGQIKTDEGGTHLEGFRYALSTCVKMFATERKLIKEGESMPLDEDVFRGLTCVICVHHPSPQLEFRTGFKLGNADIRNIIQHFALRKFKDYFDNNPRIGIKIVKHVMRMKKLRESGKMPRSKPVRKTESKKKKSSVDRIIASAVPVKEENKVPDGVVSFREAKPTGNNRYAVILRKFKKEFDPLRSDQRLKTILHAMRKHDENSKMSGYDFFSGTLPKTITSSLQKESGNADVLSQLMVPLKHLKLKEGWKLDCQVFGEHMGAIGDFYLRKNKETAYLAAPFSVIPDGSPESAWERVLLDEANTQFYLGWHEGYRMRSIITDIRRFDKEADTCFAGMEAWKSMDDSGRTRLLENNFSPSVVMEDRIAKVEYHTFSPFRGLIRIVRHVNVETGELLRRNDDVDEVIVKYYCQVYF